ncbi:MAG: isoprenylcysteine carboxylmethyltransferase family protein [Anaerolineales bacterium]|jgi:protein-S-isoprenylcysteine O-methyltransferase Ste14
MNQFKRWAEKEYSLAQRLLALLPAAVLFVFLLPWLLAFILPGLDQTFNLPSLSFGLVNLLASLVLLLPGVFFALWSIYAQMARARGTPLPMLPTQELLIDGPFKLCRNPMTLGTILMYLGISIGVGSVSSILFVLILAGLLLAYLKGLEEAELEERFGEAYRTYKANTPFILPRIFPHRGS